MNNARSVVHTEQMATKKERNQYFIHRLLQEHTPECIWSPVKADGKRLQPGILCKKTKKPK